MRVRINKTTLAGFGAVAAGLWGEKLGLDRDTQAQLVTAGVLAMTGRHTLEKILDELRGRPEGR